MERQMTAGDVAKADYLKETQTQDIGEKKSFIVNIRPFTGEINVVIPFKANEIHNLNDKEMTQKINKYISKKYPEIYGMFNLEKKYQMTELKQKSQERQAEVGLKRGMMRQ